MVYIFIILYPNAVALKVHGIGTTWLLYVASRTTATYIAAWGLGALSNADKPLLS